MFTVALVNACLLAGTWPASSLAGEYQGSDFLPTIRYLAFSRDAVGFVSRESGYVDLYGSGVSYFVYDRGSREVAEIDAARFAQRFRSSDPRDDPRPDPSRDQALMGHTSGGVEYRSKIKYCGEGVTDETRELVVNKKSVRIRARRPCTSVTSVELIGDQLWLGTAYSGEAGLSKAEGVIVQDLKSTKVLARISALSGAVSRVQIDPVSKNVWAITEDGIYEISRQFKILSINLSYQDFDPATGQPRYFFAEKTAHGNPFAVVARWLPLEDRKAFYEAADQIPTADVAKFSLYDFNMCCDFGEPKYPASFRILTPFLIRANDAPKARGYSNVYRQTLCRMGTPETRQYCSRMP